MRNSSFLFFTQGHHPQARQGLEASHIWLTGFCSVSILKDFDLGNNYFIVGFTTRCLCLLGRLAEYRSSKPIFFGIIRSTTKAIINIYGLTFYLCIKMLSLMKSKN